MSEKRGESSSELETERGELEDARSSRVTLVIHHREGTAVVALEERVPVVIGRSDPSGVVVRDSRLSRQHARVVWDGTEVTVEDLGSTNGTMVRGKRVTSPCPIGPGDEALLGSVSLAVTLVGPLGKEPDRAEGYDRFSSRLEEELLRARVFARPLALLMIKAAEPLPAQHAGVLLPHVRGRLRAVDAVGVYGPGHLLAILPETFPGAARRLAAAVAAPMPPGVPAVVVGLACFPSDATSAEALVAAARSAARGASLDDRVRGAEAVDDELAEGGPVVVDEATRRLFEQVGRVARSSAPVLVVGETGAGKEIVARTLHEESARRSRPLRVINCGAIPEGLVESTLFGHERGAFTGADRAQEGLFEQAAGGTVFLDEVGELSPAAQAALLRAIETKQVTRIGSPAPRDVDVRIVAATNRDLEAMAEAGEFRRDLLFRMNAVVLEVPPLRQRPEDIVPLAERFARQAARDSDLPPRSLDEEARAALRGYGWPGNVRELRNAIERAVVVAEGAAIRAEDLPARVRGEAPERSSPPSPFAEGDLDLKERVRGFEREVILAALERAGGNQTRAARLLRMPLRTLVYKLRAHGITKG